MNGRFAVTEQEGIHLLPFQQNPLARLTLDVGGIHHDQRIGVLDRAGQGERQRAAIEQGHVVDAGLLYRQGGFERLKHMNAYTFVGE